MSMRKSNVRFDLIDRKRESYITALVLILVGAAFALSYETTVPSEDAVILYEYAKNLATRGIITYGAGGNTPIEGATDFLYMISIAFMSKLGLSEFGSALILNYAGVILVCYLLRRSGLSTWLIAVAIVATPYVYASLLGFSAIVFSAAYLFCFYLLIKNDNRVYLAILVLCLIRPDGVIWGSGLVAVRFLNTDRALLRSELARLSKHLVVPGVVYFCWRVWYFNEWLPLPFIVKASGERNWGYAVECMVPIFVPTVAVIVFMENRVMLAKRALVLFGVPMLFYCFMRLEQNVGDRFFAPAFFGLLMLFSIESTPRVSAGFVILSAYLSWQFTSDTFANTFYELHSRKTAIHSVGPMLQRLTPGKMLTTEAGELAYYTNWVVQDSWGLNTPKFAHNLITKADIKDGSYDLIVAHCEIGLLNSTSDPEEGRSPQRTWENQCLALTGFIRNSDYDIFLIPALDAPLESRYGTRVACVLHFIYAVSPRYSQAAQVKRILLSLGGVPYNRVGHSYVDDLICSAGGYGL